MKTLAVDSDLALSKGTSLFSFKLFDSSDGENVTFVVKILGACNRSSVFYKGSAKIKIFTESELRFKLQLILKLTAVLREYYFLANCMFLIFLVKAFHKTLSVRTYLVFNCPHRCLQFGPCLA